MPQTHPEKSPPPNKAKPVTGSVLRVSDLAPARSYGFELQPDAAAREGLARALGILAVRKLRFSGRIEAAGRGEWRLEAELGATVVQPCVVTLQPVTTRIDTGVERLFIADDADPARPDADTGIRDERIESLGAQIDLAAIMAEALALALPDYPRAQGAELGEAVFTEPGLEPLRDTDLKPFAGLAALRDKLGK